MTWSSLSSFPSLHPFLVHFPVALFTMGFVCDSLLLMRFRRPWLDRTVLLSYSVAVVSAFASAITGKISADALVLVPGRSSETVAAVGAHSDAAFLTVLLFVAVLLVRFDGYWRDRGTEGPRVSRARIAALALALVAEWGVVLTAARGGELVYRYRVGVEEGHD